MMLSRTAAYALQALAHLAGQGHGRPVTAEAIARAYGVSEQYLRKVLKRLVNAGILRSDKGANGGYQLARPAAAVTVLEVVEAADAPLAGHAPPVGQGGPLDRRLGQVCEGAAGLVRGVLGGVRLSDLAAAGKKSRA